MDYRKLYQSWLNDKRLCEEGKQELQSIANDEKTIEYRFGGEMEFGTAGMRGVIGYGINVMNVYTVMRATQGLCEWIKSLGQTAMARGVVISYDTRRKSSEFAKAAASRKVCKKLVGRAVPIRIIGSTDDIVINACLLHF